jgi:hypothetical protein
MFKPVQGFLYLYCCECSLFNFMGFDIMQSVLILYSEDKSTAPTRLQLVDIEHYSINLFQPSGFFTYQQGLTFKNSTWRSLCVECFVRISEQTATFASYSTDWVVFITVVGSVYCAVRTDSLYKTDYVSSLKG